MLYSKLSVNASHQGRRIIGLIGINRGVGVTYTGMLLAYYFSSEKRNKTAYLECNSHLDFARLQEAYEWSNEDERTFTLDRTTYYKQVAKNQIPEILNDDYDCYILDFGTDYTSFMKEFIRCGNKIIIGDSAIWNQSRMITFLKSIENNKGSKNWTYMIPYADKRLVLGMANETDRCFIGIPFEPDPTSLSKETHRLFHKLFD